jgi:IstB-like ATP binding protein
MLPGWWSGWLISLSALGAQIVRGSCPDPTILEIFGDEATGVAMIDRLVHHAEILSLKGDSYRLRDKDLGTPRPRLTDPLRSAFRAPLRRPVTTPTGGCIFGSC